MLTYILLNSIFLAIVLAGLRRFLPTARRSWYITLSALLLLTAVFDNIIISLEIVAYNPQTLLGIYIYKAPIEDFFYALLSVYLVPALWKYFDTNERKPKENHG